MNRVFPRQIINDFSVGIVDESTWTLSEQTNTNFTLVIFYRGLHCPVCAKYLAELHRRLDSFKQLGVGVIAISSDTKQRALQSKQDWQLENLPIGYQFDFQIARQLGLYLSTSNGKTSIGIIEPDVFIEPGLFVIRPDLSLYFSSIQTMPFARPNFAEVLASLEFVINNNYPARGEIIDL